MLSGPTKSAGQSWLVKPSENESETPRFNGVNYSLPWQLVGLLVFRRRFLAFLIAEPMMTWALSQLVSYSLLEWSLFLSITVVAAYVARGWGIIAGHIAIACVVICFDLQWIQTAMNAPGWNGTPDMDVVFHIGLWMRVILINTVLLPLALLTRWLSIQRTK